MSAISEGSSLTELRSALPPDEKTEASFYASADALFTNLNSRLGGGGFGDITIAGSKVTHAKNHPELFKVRQLLESLLAEKQKQNRPVEKLSDDDSEQKTTAKMNNNMIATIRSIIGQEMDSKLRDLNIMNDRLQGQVKGCESKVNSLSAENEDLKLRLKRQHKSAIHGEVQNKLPQIRTLEKKMADIEEKIGSAQLDALPRIISRLTRVERDFIKPNTSGESLMSALKARVEALEKNGYYSYERLLGDLDHVTVIKDGSVAVTANEQRRGAKNNLLTMATASCEGVEALERAMSKLNEKFDLLTKRVNDNTDQIEDLGEKLEPLLYDDDDYEQEPAPEYDVSAEYEEDDDYDDENEEIWYRGD